MKRQEIVKFLPRLAALKREAKTKLKEAAKLTRQGQRAQDIVDVIDGVKLHGEFPLKTFNYQGGVEVLGACDETRRSAYVKPEDGRYAVVAYRNDGGDVDGMTLEGTYSKGTALRIAKDFVATGRLEQAKPRRPATRDIQT